jgi:hypothetical protein
MAECKTCGANEDETDLTKCPICHKMFCDEHKLVRSGRAFCSTFCADGFFFDEDEDADDAG